MTPPAPDEKDGAAPSPSAILVVFLVYVAGTTCSWGFLSIWGLVLVLAAAGLAFWFHARPAWRGPAPEAMLLGIFIACVAANCWLQSGLNENSIPGPNLTYLQRFAAQDLTGPGVAIKVLAAVALLLAVSYFSPNARGLLRRRFAALFLIAVALRILVLFSTPDPTIDVVVSQREAGEGLLEGKRFAVDAVAAAAGYSKEDVARYAASVERPFEGAIACAMAGYAQRHNMEAAEVVNFEAFPGNYDRAVAGGKEIFVGLPDGLRQAGLDVSAFSSEAERSKSEGKKLVLVAVGKTVVGAMRAREAGEGPAEGRRFVVDAVLATPGCSREDVARYAAAVERPFEGPLASAIAGYALRRRLEVADAVNFEALPGNYDRAVIGEKEILVGMSDGLRQAGVNVSAFLPEAQGWKTEGKKAVLVATGKTVVGAIRVKETRNVYEMTFTSPYNPGQWFCSYAYPPAVVYCNSLSWLLFKEVRGIWIVCDLLAAWLMYLLARRSNPGEKGVVLCELLALTFLFLPRSLFVIEQSWTEPLVVVSMAAFALAAARGRGQALTGCLLGLWLSSKQYAVLAVPQVLKLFRLRAKMWLYAVGFGLALAMPFIIWNFDALMQDLVFFFVKSGGRPDGLSLYGLLLGFTGIPEEPLPLWAKLTGVVVAGLWIAGIAWFTWKMPRNLAGMLFAAAGAWMFFFLLGKQAFMNYFYMISFTLLLAVAAGESEKVRK